MIAPYITLVMRAALGFPIFPKIIVQTSTPLYRNRVSICIDHISRVSDFNVNMW